MKTATATLLLLFISFAAAQNRIVPREFVLKTVGSVRKALEEAKSYLETIDNSTIPVLNIPQVPGHQLKLSSLQLTDTKIEGISNIDVTKLIGSYKNQYVKAIISVPLIKLTGNYNLEGSYEGESIQGGGTFEFKLIDILIRLKGSLSIVNFKPKMNGIEFGHIIGHVQLRATGLTGETAVYKQFNQIGADYILVALNNFYNANERKLSTRLLAIGNTLATGNGDLEEQAEALTEIFIPPNSS